MPDDRSDATPEPQLTRRTVVAGALAAAGAGAVAGPAHAVRRSAVGKRLAAGVHPPVKRPWRHAIGDPRGSDIAVALGREREGRFGLMFKKLPAFSPPDHLLLELAAGMADPADATDVENPYMPSGFTYLGQFIDHDMTFDHTPLTEQASDPHGVRNFNSPRFDLASVYGRGPIEDPGLYDPAEAGKLRLETTADGFADLPRAADGRAVLGDPRNDENLIISQLHTAFIRFHNRLVDRERSFADAQRLTRWHFQWLIVHDFLPQVAGQDRVDRFLQTEHKRNPGVRSESFKPRNPTRPMMPIEYSAAAYRFGHSMVRAAYVMNEANQDAPAPIFADPPSELDLHGGRPVPPRHRIEWENFFLLPGREGDPRNRARRIDTRLAAGLFTLPSPQVIPAVPAPPIVSLAARNLLRGKRLGLPAGQDVARAMGVTPLTNDELGLTDPRWQGKAPLWYYLLAESERREGGTRLGEVAGRLIAETILTLIDLDLGSYFHAKPRFVPRPPIAGAKGEFTTGDMLLFALDGGR